MASMSFFSLGLQIVLPYSRIGLTLDLKRSAKISLSMNLNVRLILPITWLAFLCVHIHRIIHLLLSTILTLNIIRKCQTFPSTQRFVVTCYCGLIDENATAFLIGALVSKHNAHWLWHRAFKDIRHRKFRPYPRIHIANRYFLMSAESFFGSIFGFSLDISSLSDAVC